MINTVYVRGSDVSAACGKNPYQKVNDSLMSKIHKYNNGIYEDICKTNNERLDKKIQKYSKNNGNIKELLKDNTKLTIEEKKIIEEKSSILRGRNEELKDLSSYVSKKNEEIVKEITKDGTIDIKEVEEEIKTKKINIRNNNNKIFKLYLGNGILIKSKIDGVKYVNNEPIELVETKRRRNRLFNEIPIYEQVQLETYLRSIEFEYKEVNITKATHIENYQNDSNEIIYEKNDDLWNEICTGLDEFLKKYIEYVNSL